MTRFFSDTLLWGLAFILAASWPVLFFSLPVGQDSLNHLARAFILLNPDDPLLNQHFVINWKPAPNLAWDGFVMMVGRWLPLNWALKIFMLLSLALTMIGVALLNRKVVGYWTWLPFAAVPFLFHTGYSKGFLSFNLSVGVALLACAWWYAWDERHWRQRLLVASALSTILFFTHFVAWGIYGIFVLGLKITELVAQWRAKGFTAILPWTKELLRDGVQAIPPFVIFAAASMANGTSLQLAGVIRGFDWPYMRIVAAWHVIDTGRWFPSVLFLGIVAFFSFYWLGTRRVSLTPRFTIPIGMLALLFFLLPDEIFATHYIVWRISLGVFLLMIAAGTPIQPIGALSTRVFLGIFLAVTLGLSGWQALSISNSGPGQRDFVSLIQRIPQGDTLFMIHVDVEPFALEFNRLGLYHIGALAVTERKIMVQSLFANPAQQPISYREAEYNNVTVNGRVFAQDLQRALDAQGESFAEHVANFNWVILHGPSPALDAREVPLAGFLPAGRHGDFRLYCKARQMTDPVSGNKLTVCPDGNEP